MIFPHPHTPTQVAPAVGSAEPTGATPPQDVLRVEVSRG